MENKKEKKERIVKIRLSETDYQKLKSFSRISNLTMSEILRKLMNDRPPKVIENLPVEEFKKTGSGIIRIGNFLKKLHDTNVKIISNNLPVTQNQIIEIKRKQDEEKEKLRLEIIKLQDIALEILKGLR